MGTLKEASFKKVAFAMEKDKKGVIAGVMTKAVPIGALKRRAACDRADLVATNRGDGLPQLIQPRPAIFVIKGPSGTHFLNIVFRVKAISFEKLTAELLSQGLADGRLTCSADPHDDH